MGNKRSSIFFCRSNVNDFKMYHKAQGKILFIAGDCFCNIDESSSWLQCLLFKPMSEQKKISGANIWVLNIETEIIFSYLKKSNRNTKQKEKTGIILGDIATY